MAGDIVVVETMNKGDDSNGLDCQTCKIVSTVGVAGVSAYLFYSARKSTQHRVFLNLAGAGRSLSLDLFLAMLMFSAANWGIRSSISKRD